MMPLEIAWAATVQWLAGDVMCRVMMFTRTFGLYLSSYVLICIAIDRYEKNLFYLIFSVVLILKDNKNGKNGKNIRILYTQIVTNN